MTLKSSITINLTVTIKVPITPYDLHWWEWHHGKGWKIVNCFCIYLYNYFQVEKITGYVICTLLPVCLFVPCINILKVILNHLAHFVFMMRIAVDNVISLHWNDTILCMCKIVSIHIYFQFMYSTILNVSTCTCNNTHIWLHG